MTQVLRLHYAPDNASLCVRLTLEELGIAFETVLVDRRLARQKSPAYLALNPNGLIPTLETPQGPIFETAAILLWLADVSGDLMPRPDATDRGAALKWLFWLSNTLHPAERMLFYPDKYIAAPLAPDLRQATCDRIKTLFTLLEAEADWLEGPTTILSCYLAPLLRWPALYGARPGWMVLSDWPRLFAFAQVFEARPAAQKAAAAEGLGPTPFSQPSLPNPPEGSAV